MPSYCGVQKCQPNHSKNHTPCLHTPTYGEMETVLQLRDPGHWEVLTIVGSRELNIHQDDISTMPFPFKSLRKLKHGKWTSLFSDILLFKFQELVKDTNNFTSSIIKEFKGWEQTLVGTLYTIKRKFCFIYVMEIF